MKLAQALDALTLLLAIAVYGATVGMAPRLFVVLMLALALSCWAMFRLGQDVGESIAERWAK